MKEELRRYYRYIERALVSCSRKKRRFALQSIQADVEAYMQESANPTIQEVYVRFGTPEQIAEAFLRNGDLEETDRQFNTRRWIVRIVLAAVAALVAAFIVFGTIFVVDNWQYSHGYVVEYQAHEVMSEFESERSE